MPQMPGRGKAHHILAPFKANTETLLEIIGALCFFHVGVPCSKIPGKAKGWQNCFRGRLLALPKLLRAKAADSGAAESRCQG